MTKRALFFLGAMLLVHPCVLRAQDDLIPDRTPNSSIGIRFGSYAPVDAVFGEVYGKSGLIFGLSLGRDLYRSGGFTLGLALEAGKFSRTGVSTISAAAARLALIPLSLSLEAVVSRGVVGLWLGGGFDLVFYTEDSAWILSNGSVFGFHIGGGLTFQLPAGPALKVYARWTKAAKTMEDFSVALGGTEIGAAVLFRFKL